MKNWKRYLALALLICFAVTVVPVEAHADALTATMIADLAYGIASGMGISFSVGSGTGQGVSSFMQGQVEDYVNERGGTLLSVFQGEAAISAAGKLLIAQNLYNSVTGFVDWLRDKFPTNTLTQGEYKGEFMPSIGTGETGDQVPTGVGLEAIFTGYIEANPAFGRNYGGYTTVDAYNDGAKISLWNLGMASSALFDGSYSFEVRNGSIYLVAPAYYTRTGDLYNKYQSLIVANAQMTNTIEWRFPQDWTAPQPLPQDKSMEQTYKGPGFAEPQDLPDFLSKIPAAVADGTLDVVDTVVDDGGSDPPPSPSPSPSPAPSGPKLSIAEKIGIIIGEIIGILYDTTGDTATETIDQLADDVQDVTQSITDAITETQISTSGQTQTAIQDQTQTITDTITQTQTQTQTAIQDQTQTITDTITDTQTEIKDAIQDMTDTQTDIKDAIQDITDVPDQWEPQKHPLPRGVFPFCIPFDLHDLILALSAEPQTPEVHVPFDLNLPLPGGRSLPFHYQFDLDLHDFDGLAQVLRTLEFIAFGVGLLFVTGKVIKW